MASAKNGNVYGKTIMAKYSPLTKLSVHRPVYQQEDLNRDTLYEEPINSSGFCCLKCGATSAISCFFRLVPVAKWLPKYRWRKWIWGDIISGLTVAVMHIPQGLAYAMLGKVPPIVGIYMAFFPVLVYFIFGTSRHVSIGTFAVVCLMTGAVVEQYSTNPILRGGSIENKTLTQNEIYGRNLEVAITVTFCVAIAHLIGFVFRMGVISTLLSEVMVNGFTCACAFHVMSSQFKDYLGLSIQKHRGYFSFVLTCYDAVLALPNANMYSVGTSAVATTLLLLNNHCLKPYLEKKTKIPFPIELTVVVLGTAFSYYVHRPDSIITGFNITTVGHIPTGLPAPTLPNLSLIPYIVKDAILIAIVSYTVTLSMGLMFSRKLMYEVDANQELLAMGLSNIVGSFFSCLPITASLSRSIIQQAVGGFTQLASIVSCFILLFILLWIGPAFEMLPRCCLASIILVALKGMLLQFTALPGFYKLSKLDAFIWVATFFTTLLVDIGTGLLAGIIATLICIYCHGYRPYSCVLAQVPNTDLYLDMKRYKKVQEIPGVIIFHYSGILSFASQETFKRHLKKRIGFDPVKVLAGKKRAEELNLDSYVMEDLPRCIILDFSALTCIDPAGVSTLKQFYEDFAALDINMLIAGCSGPVFEQIIRWEQIMETDVHFVIFPTIHDAVLYNAQLVKQDAAKSR